MKILILTLIDLVIIALLTYCFYKRARDENDRKLIKYRMIIIVVMLIFSELSAIAFIAGVKGNINPEQAEQEPRPTVHGQFEPIEDSALKEDEVFGSYYPDNLQEAISVLKANLKPVETCYDENCTAHVIAGDKTAHMTMLGNRCSFYYYVNETKGIEVSYLGHFNEGSEEGIYYFDTSILEDHYEKTFSMTDSNYVKVDGVELPNGFIKLVATAISIFNEQYVQ